MRTPWLIICVALLLYSPLFIFEQIGPIDFWNWMALIVLLLLALIGLRDRSWLTLIFENIKSKPLKMAIIGVLSAALLYFIFYIGNWTSRFLFNFASRNIENVYSLKEGTEKLRIALYIILLIGPAEELIWRSYVQEKFMQYLSPTLSLLLTTFFYIAIHWGSFNFMLLMAALVCGLFWGTLYMKYKSVWLNIISHTFWDLAVFIFFPFS